MALDPRRVKALFNAALDLSDPAERPAFLDRECQGDAELPAPLDELLAAYDEPPAPWSSPLAADGGGIRRATVSDSLDGGFVAAFGPGPRRRRERRRRSSPKARRRIG